MTHLCRGPLADQPALSRARRVALMPRTIQTTATQSQAIGGTQRYHRVPPSATANPRKMAASIANTPAHANAAHGFRFCVKSTQREPRSLMAINLRRPSAPCGHRAGSAHEPKP